MVKKCTDHGFVILLLLIELIVFPVNLSRPKRIHSQKINFLIEEMLLRDFHAMRAVKVTFKQFLFYTNVHKSNAGLTLQLHKNMKHNASTPMRFSKSRDLKFLAERGLSFRGHMR